MNVERQHEKAPLFSLPLFLSENKRKGKHFSYTSIYVCIYITHTRIYIYIYIYICMYIYNGYITQYKLSVKFYPDKFA